ncbi:MAG: FAD-binding oxidoreductase [Deltaproteobacteria bacterium]|nr:FAD-binding oxidoreductase [Deltaproteobacteria bacterium]
MKEFSIDDISLTVTCDVTLRLAELEKKLEQRGYTLGYEPISGNNATLRQLLDQAILNHWAARYGEIGDICMALLVESKMGKIQTKKVPRAATGPDLKKIFIGSRGSYGKILEATFRISPLPEKQKMVRIVLKQKQHKKPFLLKVLESGLRPAEIQEKGLRFSFNLHGPSSIVHAEEATLKKIVKNMGARLGS